jgi:phage tail protein X
MTKVIATKAMGRLTTAIAAVAAAICLQVSSSQAQYYGDAPWCAVLQIGTGSVTWHCYYRTVEECVPNVLAGNRGSCNLNPYFTASRAPAITAHPTRHKRQHG